MYFTVVGLKKILRIKKSESLRSGGLSRHTGCLATQGGTVTVQEHTPGQVPLGSNECLSGKKEIRKERSDL